jgi:hypothetical protein
MMDEYDFEFIKRHYFKIVKIKNKIFLLKIENCRDLKSSFFLN